MAVKRACLHVAGMGDPVPSISGGVHSRAGKAWWELVSQGTAGQARLGVLGSGYARSGSLGKVWHGVARLGEVRHTAVRRVCCGMAWRGLVRHGKHGGHVEAWFGQVWRGTRGTVRLVTAPCG